MAVKIPVPKITGKYTRERIGMRQPRSRSLNIRPAEGGSTLHWGGSGSRLAGHQTCITIWRGWQDYHMDTKGWVDIAYTMGYCQHGWVFPGRGYGVRTAGQGTNRGNDLSYAFVHINEAGRGPTVEALSAMAWLVDDARLHGGAGKAVWPHWYWHNTSCPGKVLAAEAAAMNARDIPGHTMTATTLIGGDMPSTDDYARATLAMLLNYVPEGQELNLKTLWKRAYEQSIYNTSVLNQVLARLDLLEGNHAPEQPSEKS